MKVPFIKKKPVTGKKGDKFVGIKIKGNEIHFHYPQTLQFDENSDNASSEILNFLETFRLSQTPSNDSAIIYDVNDDASSFPITSSLWIIRDYLTNGLYINEEKELRLRSKGRVNWKKTLESNPIISDGNIIYKDIVTENSAPFENVIAIIYRICAKRSMELLGWLFNLNSKTIDIEPFNEKLKSYYSNVLAYEITRTFNDEHRIRLKHMKNIIDGLSPTQGDNGVFAFGINNFHYVFERMVDKMFSGEEDLSIFYPSADWHLLYPTKDDFGSSNLRPDTIMIHGSIYILDAKFYQYGFTFDKDDLPSTTSIHKQITYGEFIKKIINENKDTKKELKVDSNVYNAFILPYNKTSNKFGLNDDLVYIGNATANWKSGKSDYMTVYAFLIDLKHLIDNWNKNESKTDIEKLIDSIKAASTKETLYS